MGVNKTEDWAEIAREVRDYWQLLRLPDSLLAAADLCERYARGELVERTRIEGIVQQWRSWGPDDVACDFADELELKIAAGRR